VSAKGVNPAGEAPESLSVCAEGDWVCSSGDETGVNSALSRICRAVNSMLDSVVEFTAVKATLGSVVIIVGCWICCCSCGGAWSESLATRNSSHVDVWKGYSVCIPGVAPSDWNIVSRSSGEKFFMAPLGGEDCMTIDLLGFLARLPFPSFSAADRFLDLTTGGGEGSPGGGGGGIGANGVCGRGTGGMSIDCGGRW